MPPDISSKEMKDLFHSIYKGDKDNLKQVAIEFKKQGISEIYILLLTMKELNIPMGEAIMSLEIPDYIG